MKLEDDAYEATIKEALRKVVLTVLCDLMNAGLCFGEALVRVEERMPTLIKDVLQCIELHQEAVIRECASNLKSGGAP